MSRFVREPSPGSEAGGTPKAGAVSAGHSSRIYGDRVAIGEPVPIAADLEFRNDLESSLEILTQTRLLEAEAQAQALLAKIHAQAEAFAVECRDKALAEAEQMREQARQETDTIREAAREEGFKAGFQEGYDDAIRQAEQETVGLLQSAQSLVEGAYRSEKRVLKDFEKRAIELIDTVIKRILGDTFADAPEKTLQLVERGVESLYLSGKVKVVVNAQTLHEIRTFSRTSAEALAAMSRFEFVADPLLEAGQVYVIGQEASFDFTPTTQAAQLLEPLEQHLELPRLESAPPEEESGLAESLPAQEISAEIQFPEQADANTDLQQ